MRSTVNGKKSLNILDRKVTRRLYRMTPNHRLWEKLTLGQRLTDDQRCLEWVILVI